MSTEDVRGYLGGKYCIATPGMGRPAVSPWHPAASSLLLARTLLNRHTRNPAYSAPFSPFSDVG